MFGNRRTGGWGPRRGDQVRVPLRGLLKGIGAVIAATVVATALLPGLGVLIAVVFWLVAAAGLGVVAAPVLRRAAPHARTAWARLAAVGEPVCGPRWRRAAAWWQVRWARARMWTGRTRHAWHRPGPAALERGPRALPPGTSLARTRSMSKSRS